MFLIFNYFFIVRYTQRLFKSIFTLFQIFIEWKSMLRS